MVRKIMTVVGALTAFGLVGCAAEADDSEASAGAIGVERTPDQQAAAAAEEKRVQAEATAKRDAELLAKYKLYFAKDVTLTPKTATAAQRVIIPSNRDRWFTCAYDHPVKAPANDYVVQKESVYTFTAPTFENDEQRIVFHLVDETRKGYPTPTDLTVHCAKLGGGVLGVDAVVAAWFGMSQLESGELVKKD